MPKTIERIESHRAWRDAALAPWKSPCADALFVCSGEKKAYTLYVRGWCSAFLILLSREPKVRSRDLSFIISFISDAHILDNTSRSIGNQSPHYDTKLKPEWNLLIRALFVIYAGCPFAMDTQHWRPTPKLILNSLLRNCCHFYSKYLQYTTVIWKSQRYCILLWIVGAIDFRVKQAHIV